MRQVAYANFVRGKELAAERSPESVLRARDLFWLCLANDPNFAAAWAWFGRCCRILEKFKGGQSINFDLAESAFRRALVIDPDLACAHHFYTHLQADLGQALQAMTRLAARLKQHGEEPETFAGLVQVFRFCDSWRNPSPHMNGQLLLTQQLTQASPTRIFCKESTRGSSRPTLANATIWMLQHGRPWGTRTMQSTGPP